MTIFAVDGGDSEYGSIKWETGKYLIEHRLAVLTDVAAREDWILWIFSWNLMA